MAIRVLISDLVLTGHPESVRAGVLAGYGAGLTEAECLITVDASLADAMVYASEGPIYEAGGTMVVVRSASGNFPADVALDISTWQALGIQAVMPLGSNESVELLAPASIPGVVTCGAGVTANQTAFGNGLEFWDEDLDAVDPALSSYSAGRIAGKLLKIKDALACTWAEARALARSTASNDGVWDMYNGYGKISVDNAVAGFIPVTFTVLTRTIAHSVLAHTSADVGAMLVFYGPLNELYYGTIATVVSASSVILAASGALPASDAVVTGLSLIPYASTTPTYASYIAEIQSMIKDGSAKLTLIAGGDLDRILAKAVSDYAKAKPFTVRKKIQGNGTDSYICATIFGNLWTHGFSAISEIEYPIGSKPKTVLDSASYELYDDGTAQDGSNIALRLDTVIGAAEYFIVSFTVEMSLPIDGVQNFPSTAVTFSNITTLAAAYACQRLAAAYAQSIDATISVDSVNYNDKSAKYQSLAKQYMRQYNVAVFGSEDPVASIGAAMVTRKIEQSMANNSPYIFHSRRFR